MILNYESRGNCLCGSVGVKILLNTMKSHKLYALFKINYVVIISLHS